jgi:hypothetical protein
MDHMPQTSACRLLMLSVCTAALMLAACGSSDMRVYGEAPSASADEQTDDEPADDRSDDRADPAEAGRKACQRLTGVSTGSAPARLLTNYEYANTVEALLGYDGDAHNNFPAENKVGSFENNANAHQASKLRVREFMQASETIAAKAVEHHFDSLLPCDPQKVGEATCGHQFIRDFLPRAFRRPPTDAETKEFVEQFDAAHTEYGFVTAIEMTIQAALQAPQFLYRIEFVRPSGPAAGEVTEVDDFDMASRLSYFLWASMPDDTLLEAARNDELSSPDQIASQVQRMLDDPRAEQSIRQFHRQWLGLDDFDSVVKDADKFPTFESSMTDDWRKSLVRFVLDTYLSDGGDFEALMTSPTVYLSDQLAELYGLPTRDDGQDAYALPEHERAGLITQPGLMALLSNANQASPIRRGVWIREKLFCQHIPPPPPNLVTEPPDPDPNATTRERFKQHTEKQACASCHRLIDPIGLGLSNFDGVGRFQTTQAGRTIDNSGEVADTRDPDIEGSFQGGAELARRLADSRQIKNCITQKWFTFAMGRAPSDREACALHRVQQAFDESGGDFETLLSTLATSEAFRHRTVPQHEQSQQ